MRGLTADEYAALVQGSAGEGHCDTATGQRLIARGLLTQPEIDEREPHPVVRVNKLGALAIRCHEAALRLVT